MLVRQYASPPCRQTGFIHITVSAASVPEDKWKPPRSEKMKRRLRSGSRMHRHRPAGWTWTPAAAAGFDGWMAMNEAACCHEVGDWPLLAGLPSSLSTLSWLVRITALIGFPGKSLSLPAAWYKPHDFHDTPITEERRRSPEVISVARQA